jgi:hypothetical protein
MLELSIHVQFSIQFLQFSIKMHYNHSPGTSKSSEIWNLGKLVVSHSILVVRFLIKAFDSINQEKLVI